jgi:plasmid stabilization system protein ParE
MDEGVRQYTVSVSERATDMLVDHARFLAQVSESAASRLVTAFKANAESLQYMPERCPWLSDPLIPEYKYRKLLFEKRYLIVFQIRDSSVYIDAVVDCRQDYGRLL